MVLSVGLSKIQFLLKAKLAQTSISTAPWATSANPSARADSPKSRTSRHRHPQPTKALSPQSQETRVVARQRAFFFFPRLADAGTSPLFALLIPRFAG